MRMRHPIDTSSFIRVIVHLMAISNSYVRRSNGISIQDADKLYAIYAK